MSELLSLPLLTSVTKVTEEGDTIIGERALKDAVETVKMKMPAVVSATREIDQPRVPLLMMIMKASKKEMLA
jgi:electron transfer flavoprotein beta subunit